jgi:hypothetical protein
VESEEKISIWKLGERRGQEAGANCMETSYIIVNCSQNIIKMTKLRKAI